MGVHAAVAAELLQDRELVEEVLRDFQSSRLPDSEKALFAFLEKLNRPDAEIEREDVRKLQEIGWSDEAIYDAVMVSALFNFYNTWVDGLGVRQLPDKANRAVGREMAANGYLHDGP